MPAVQEKKRSPTFTDTDVVGYNVGMSWNPREDGRHRERGPKKYTYTVNDVARLAQRSPATINATHACDLTELESVVAYIQAARIRSSRPLEPQEWMGAEAAHLWDDRWPRLDAYRCARHECAEVMLGSPGFCRKHGGGSPAWKIEDGHMALRIAGKYVQYHRLIMYPQCAGLDVHHVDFNSWNNRPENLVVMTKEEHMEIHRRSPFRR